MHFSRNLAFLILVIKVGKSLHYPDIVHNFQMKAVKLKLNRVKQNLIIFLITILVFIKYTNILHKILL